MAKGFSAALAMGAAARVAAKAVPMARARGFLLVLSLIGASPKKVVFEFMGKSDGLGRPRSVPCYRPGTPSDDFRAKSTGCPEYNLFLLYFISRIPGHRWH